MYIEDLIETLTLEYIPVNVWDQKIIRSFYEQVTNNTGFTEKQSVLALRIVTRYASSISSKLKVDITKFIENPQYRLPIRKILAEKTIKVVKDLIEVRLPYNDEFVVDIRKHRSANPSSVINWDKDKTSWTLDISESNILYLLSACSVGFEYDDAFQNYATQIEEVVANMENYAPMLICNEFGYSIRNASAYMPTITATDPIAAIFQARRMGVVLWDNTIEEYLTSKEVVKEVCDFLKTPISQSSNFDADETQLFVLKNILANLGPSLFVVPGGDELSKTQQAHAILKGIGVEDKNMSVLFRLPTESGRNFNDFVRNQGLNKPITADTKVVFVSGKLPKTVIKSGIKFNSVVNLGFDSVHYTLREYAKTHQNLIYFDVKKQKRGFNFAQL